MESLHVFSKTELVSIPEQNLWLLSRQDLSKIKLTKARAWGPFSEPSLCHSHLLSPKLLVLQLKTE